jgi:hypothetical protein
MLKYWGMQIFVAYGGNVLVECVRVCGLAVRKAAAGKCQLHATPGMLGMS